MKSILIHNRISHLTMMLVSALLLLTPVLAVLPGQPALAATTCVNYHVVKSGEKKAEIAQTYGLKWKVIAKANNISTGENPKVDDRLCIPKQVSDTAKLAKLAQGFTPTYNSGRISFPLATLAAGLWKIKVRDANTSSGGWDELSKFDPSNEKGPNYSFKLPSDLNSTPRVSVCLKNQKTDQLICKVVSTGAAASSSSSSGGTSSATATPTP
jgi:hypothetical protein